MIKTQNYAPEVYYNQSRDFQLIGRLFDVMFNSVKTNETILQNLPLTDNTDTKLLDLLASTLGFKSRHNYNVKQLEALCAVLPQIMKKKGSIDAVKLAGSALLGAEGIKDEFDCYIVARDGSEIINNETYEPKLILYIPNTLSDINLLNDLLIYIIPAGIPCRIVRTLEMSSEGETKVNTQDKLSFNESIQDLKVSVIPTIEDVQDNIATTQLRDDKGILANNTIVKVAAKDTSTNTNEEN